MIREFSIRLHIEANYRRAKQLFARMDWLLRVLSDTIGCAGTGGMAKKQTTLHNLEAMEARQHQIQAPGGEGIERSPSTRGCRKRLSWSLENESLTASSSSLINCVFSISWVTNSQI